MKNKYKQIKNESMYDSWNMDHFIYNSHQMDGFIFFIYNIIYNFNMSESWVI